MLRVLTCVRAAGGGRLQIGMVAGFVSEPRPASNRNGGRLRVGMPGRIKSESAAFLRHVIDHIQNPESAAAGELIVHEVERPAGVGTGLSQKRKAERTIEAPQKQRKAKFFLSGLLKCGCCGVGMSMKDRDHGRVRILCSTMRESGSCDNRKIFYMDEVEKAVLVGLQRHLKTPTLLKEFAKTYQDEWERLAGENAGFVRNSKRS